MSIITAYVDCLPKGAHFTEYVLGNPEGLSWHVALYIMPWG